MESINKEDKPAKPIEKENDGDQHKIQKAGKEKGREIDADNDNGFVSPATESSSNKGQGPAGEDV